MTEYRLYTSDVDIECPECLNPLNSHLALPPGQRPQPEQSATACAHCGRAWIYCERNGKLALRAPSKPEFDKLLLNADMLGEMAAAKLRNDGID